MSEQDLRAENLRLREGLARAAGYMEGVSRGLEATKQDDTLARALSTEAFRARRHLEGKPL